MKTALPNNAAVYALAWPIAMNAILQQAILVIDTLLVAGLGEESVAALGIAISVTGLILGILFALSNGTQILVAQSFGANNHLALKSGFWSGFETMASDYLLVMTITIAALAATQNFSVFLYSTGNPRIPLYSKMLELPVNALFSYLFIYGVAGFPAYGVMGAAIGSAISVALRFVFLIFYLYRDKFAYLLTPGWTKNSVQGAVSTHLTNALPIAGTFISMNFAFTICAMIYSQMKIVEFAAITLLMIWLRTSGLIVTSWSQSIGIWVGRLLGQDQIEPLDSFVKSAWKVALALSLAISITYGLLPVLFRLIYPNLEAETVSVIRTLVPLLIFLPFVRSSNTVCGNVLRAAGQANYAFKVHVTTQWLFTVPMTALFVLYFELSVFWVFSIIVMEELLKAIPFHTKIASGVWKQKIAQ